LLIPKVQPNVRQQIVQKQNDFKSYYDRSTKPLPELKPNQNILIQNKNIWEPGKVVSTADAPRSYYVVNEENNILRRNRVQLRPSENSPNFHVSDDIQSFPECSVKDAVSMNAPSNGDIQSFPECSVKDTVSMNAPSKQIVTRYGRVVRPPDRLQVS